MTTTTKNRDYYLDVLCTPCYLMRKMLNEDYRSILCHGINTLEFFAMVADHLTAYNEIAMTSPFFRIRDFKNAI